MYDKDNRGGTKDPKFNGIKTNRTGICEFMGWSTTTFDRYLADGMPYHDNPSGKRKIYDSRECIEWWVENRVKTKFKKVTPDDDEVDLSHERALLAREQRIEKEIKNDILRGNLIEAENALIAIAKIFSSGRNKLLAIRPKLKTRLPELTDEQINVIDALVVNACNEMPEHVERDLWDGDIPEESEFNPE